MRGKDTENDDKENNILKENNKKKKNYPNHKQIETKSI